MAIVPAEELVYAELRGWVKETTVRVPYSQIFEAKISPELFFQEVIGQYHWVGEIKVEHDVKRELYIARGYTLVTSL